MKMRMRHIGWDIRCYINGSAFHCFGCLSPLNASLISTIILAVPSVGIWVAFRYFPHDLIFDDDDLEYALEPGLSPSVD